MTIADRIQSLRKAKGVSQEELADRIGSPDRRFQNGNRNRVRRM